MSPFKWQEPISKGTPPMGMFDPEIKISDDAKKFILDVLTRLEDLLRHTIFWKETK